MCFDVCALEVAKLNKNKHRPRYFLLLLLSRYFDSRRERASQQHHGDRVLLLRSAPYAILNKSQLFELDALVREILNL